MSFLDKLKKGVTEAQTKVTVTVEVNRLRMQISSKKKDIESEYRRIGEAYFANFTGTEKKDIEPLLNSHCENIVAIQKEIREIEEKIKEINNEKSCECGKIVPRETKFCPSCGHKFEDEPAAALEQETGAAEETIRCSSCNTEMEADAKFCPSCGTPHSGGGI